MLDRPPRFEPLGQRYFITGLNGVLIDAIKPIPPSAEFPMPTIKNFVVRRAVELRASRGYVATSAI